MQCKQIAENQLTKKVNKQLTNINNTLHYKQTADKCKQIGENQLTNVNKCSVVCRLNVNKVSRISHDFFLKVELIFWCNYQNAI